MNFNYGEVLSKAWQIIWKFKVLWIFGLLASCGRSGGGSSGGGGGSGGDATSSGAGSGFSYDIQRWFDNLDSWMVVVGIILLVIFIVLLIFIINYVSTVGRIGLVRGTVKGDQGTERMTFAELLQTSGPLFWRVFWLNLLGGLVIGIVFLILLLPMIGLSIVTFGLGLLCLIPFICLLVPVSWVVGIWLEQANISMIVEESSISSALRKAWEVMKLNLVTYLVMAIILGLIGLLVGVVAFFPVIAIMVPILTGAMVATEQAITIGAIISVLCCAVYFPILLVMNGVATAYTGAAWTLTYLRLTRLGAPAPTEAAPYLEEEIPSPS